MTILSSSRANLNCLKKIPNCNPASASLWSFTNTQGCSGYGNCICPRSKISKIHWLEISRAEQDVFGHTFPETAKQPWITWIFQHIPPKFTESLKGGKNFVMCRLRLPGNFTAGQGREQLKNLRLGVISSEKCQGKSQGNSINGRQHLRNISIRIVKWCYRSASYTEVTFWSRDVNFKFEWLLLATPGNSSWSMVIP